MILLKKKAGDMPAFQGVNGFFSVPISSDSQESRHPQAPFVPFATVRPAIRVLAQLIMRNQRHYRERVCRPHAIETECKGVSSQSVFLLHVYYSLPPTWRVLIVDTSIDERTLRFWGRRRQTGLSHLRDEKNSSREIRLQGLEDALPGESPSGLTWEIIELCDCHVDALLRRGSNIGLAINYPRDRFYRHPGEFSDVKDGRFFLQSRHNA